MTYYGRWTYKFEEAPRHGALGAIFVHQTEPEAYGWSCAQNLFAANGTTLMDAVKRANTRGFRAEPLASTASATHRNSIRRTSSQNVAALLPGTKRPNEFLVYMADWDHLGRLPGCSGDCVFNGAVDNATGSAGVLALAKALIIAKTKLERSMLLAVGATLAGEKKFPNWKPGSEFRAAAPKAGARGLSADRDAFARLRAPTCRASCYTDRSHAVRCSGTGSLLTR